MMIITNRQFEDRSFSTYSFSLSTSCARRCVSGNSNRSFSRSSTGAGGKDSTENETMIRIERKKFLTYSLRLSTVEWLTFSNNLFVFYSSLRSLCFQPPLVVVVVQPKTFPNLQTHISDLPAFTNVRRFNSGTPPSKTKIGLILKCNNLQIRCSNNNM